jgi:hypothetical protein
MMPYEMCTKDMLRAIFAGEKSLLKLNEVRYISVSKYDELSVKHLYEDLLALDGMRMYFPEKYPKGRQCDRSYLFNIANTLHPEVMKEVVQHAHQHRHSVEGEKQNQEAVLATDFWADQLRAMPFFSKVSFIFITNFSQREKERCQHC